MQEWIKMFWQLILVIIFLLTAFFLSSYLSSLEDRPVPELAPEFKNVTVEAKWVPSQAANINFSATGNVHVRAYVNLVPQVSGKIVYVSPNVFPGSAFEGNEVLFKIDQRDFESEVKRSEAEVSRAEAEFDLQKAQSDAAIEEWKAFHSGEPVPPLVAKLPQLERARSELAAAKAGLAIAKLQVERTSYSFPYKGRITETRLELGQFVTAGQSYGEGYALNALEIRVPLGDQELTWLLEAIKPEITIITNYFGTRKVLKAKLKRLSTSIDPLTRMGYAIFEPEKSHHKLLPNIFVEVEIIGPERKMVWLLPLNALQSNNLIWKVDKDQRLKLVVAEIIYIGKKQVMVQSDGEAIRVVTSVLSGVSEGVKVEVKK